MAEPLITDILNYDEALYLEAKLILENRNVKIGLLNTFEAGIWRIYLVSCSCGIAKYFCTTSNLDPLEYLV